MFKVLGFIPRRPDLTRAFFRDYYETRHVVLALRTLRGFSKYVRNHVVRSAPQEPGFDCLPEWWFDSPKDAADIAAWVASPAGQVLHEDEAKFMDRPRMASCPVNERLLFGPARIVESGVVRKLGLVLTRAGATSTADFEAELTRFGKELMRRNEGAITRVCLDVPVDPRQVDPRLHALFSIWPATPESPIDVPQGGPAVGGLTEVTFEAIETPTAALRD
jgi:uncharacterized protein (TIGR02118 family)